jgi:hypothetical protein
MYNHAHSHGVLAVASGPVDEVRARRNLELVIPCCEQQIYLRGKQIRMNTTSSSSSTNLKSLVSLWFTQPNASRTRIEWAIKRQHPLVVTSTS